MRILLLSRYGRLGASSRLRFYGYLSFLESQGIKTRVAPLLADAYVEGLYNGRRPVASVIGAYLARIGLALQARRFDVLWVEKEMLPWVPGFIEVGMLPGDVPLVVDYDDAVFHRYDRHRFGLVRAFLGNKIDAVMRRADLVIVGNDYLGDRARQAGARRVELLPTVVDLERYSVIDSEPTGPITIGWIGSPATAHYLRLVGDVLRKMAASRGVRIVAVGAKPAQLEGLPIEVRPWSEDREVAEIQKFDIGIMPLPDEPFERGKCGYKLIQYMASGKPVVASAVGANKQIVRHGENGFLARDETEWAEFLEQLCFDRDLGRRMGIQGRLSVERQFCLGVTAPRLGALLRSVLES